MNTIIKKALPFFLFSFFQLQAFSQITVPVFGTQKILNGYAREISGENIAYFSVYPDYAKMALLTRCTDGKYGIAWETAPVPDNYTNVNPYLYFSWIAAHSTGTSSGPRNFDLYINDQWVLTFTTLPKNYPPIWSFAAPDSTRMVFEFRKKDGANDAHGIMYLRVPAQKYKPGNPLRIKIVGQAQNSQDWLMTFKYSFEEKIEAEHLPFLIKSPKGIQTLLMLTALHFGSDDSLQVMVGQQSIHQFPVHNGINSFQIPVDTVSSKTNLQLQASIGKLLTVHKQITISPVTRRDIYFIPHSHNDIGYSDIQENVEQLQNKNIRDALYLADKTKNYPPGSRFVWNIESLWAVENFLSIATDTEKAQFIAAVKNKQIGLSAFYANILTGLSTPEEMKWITDYGVWLRNRYQLPVKSVMMSDIPGMSWSMVSELAKQGIRYFSNGPNFVESLPDRGDRIGATLKALGDQPFWWKSSDGKDSILLWTGAKGYSSWHGTPPGGIFDRGPKKIAAYLNELDAQKYPYSMLQWRYNIVSDNGPVDSTVPDFVKEWNEKYVSPKIILSDVNSMFEAFEKKYGHSLPVRSGDLTPYWEDGAYSTALEEAAIRLLSEKLILLEQIAHLKNVNLNSQLLYRAKRDIVMFHEHTWGSWNSISDPDNPFTIHQWEYKKRFADSAGYYTLQLENELRPLQKENNKVEVYNTTAWKRTGYAEAGIPADLNRKTLMNAAGQVVLFQKLSTGKIGFIVKEIPAKKSGEYHFSIGARHADSIFHSSYTYTTDPNTGAISKLVLNGKDWVSPNQFKGLGQAIYVKGLNPDSFFLSTINKSEWIENGPVVKKQRITCSLEGCNEIVYEITQVNGQPDVLISVTIDKKAIRDKESVHIAFPFDFTNPTVRIGMDNSFITPEKGQLYGSNKDFFSVQRWIDISDAATGVTLSCPQGALFEIGSMVNEEKINMHTKKWKDSTHSASTLFLYAMNNYWHTNYKADQTGKVTFDFTLHFHGAFNLQEAQRVGMQATQELWVQ